MRGALSITENFEFSLRMKACVESGGVVGTSFSLLHFFGIKVFCYVVLYDIVFTVVFILPRRMQSIPWYSNYPGDGILNSISISQLESRRNAKNHDI